jgi:hypothetical protein
MGWAALDYLNRYLELCRIFFQRKDLESLLLFVSVLFNLRQDLPSLWSKFKEKKEGLDNEL